MITMATMQYDVSDYTGLGWCGENEEGRANPGSKELVRGERGGRGGRREERGEGGEGRGEEGKEERGEGEEGRGEEGKEEGKEGKERGGSVTVGRCL